MQLGLIDLPWWGYILVALALTHITIVAVTVFLHRHQAHRALDLHPLPSHFFRFWLWLTTGMVTKEWAAIHRKHHAKCETAEDPHSPQIFGIKKVFLEGAELYRAASKDTVSIEKYGHGTPDDWIERNLYTKHSALGISLMLIINVILFGPLGLSIWAVQMIWIPLFAAGVINGIGHYWGYRNFASADTSTNVLPWGILIGGEELHNNHHAYGTSAKLSSKWWEFDIGWMYIRILEIVGLAKVRKLAPKLRLNPAKVACDAETLQAIITHRYDVLGKFAKSLKDTAAQEINHLHERAVLGLKQSRALEAVKSWLHRDVEELPANDQAALNQVLGSSKVLTTIYSMRQELTTLWGRSTATTEQLVKQLEDWCHRAEQSGIAPLQEFSRKLRCYA